MPLFEVTPEAVNRRVVLPAAYLSMCGVVPVASPVQEASLREVMAKFATGIVVLTVGGEHCHGMTANALLMQFQADVLGVPVVRPAVTETTALGAAYAAGLAVGFWPDVATLRAQWRKDAEWTPAMAADKRDAEYRQWKKAVARTLDWVD